MRWERLDGLGPANETLEQLQNVNIKLFGQ